jgi:hypothetical protein
VPDGVVQYITKRGLYRPQTSGYDGLDGAEAGRPERQEPTLHRSEPA